jgi:hypothetical protein
MILRATSRRSGYPCSATHSHAPRADDSDQFVWPDTRAGPFGRTRRFRCSRAYLRCDSACDVSFGLSLEERFHAAAKVQVARAGILEERLTLFTRTDFYSGRSNFFGNSHSGEPAFPLVTNVCSNIASPVKVSGTTRRYVLCHRIPGDLPVLCGRYRGLVPTLATTNRVRRSLRCRADWQLTTQEL